MLSTAVLECSLQGVQMYDVCYRFSVIFESWIGGLGGGAPSLLLWCRQGCKSCASLFPFFLSWDHLSAPRFRFHWAAGCCVGAQISETVDFLREKKKKELPSVFVVWLILVAEWLVLWWGSLIVWNCSHGCIVCTESSWAHTLLWERGCYCVQDWTEEGGCQSELCVFFLWWRPIATCTVRYSSPVFCNQLEQSL